jgi:hypothetical protein
MARRCAGSGCRGGRGGVWLAGREGGGCCEGGGLMAGGGVVVEREGAQYCVVVGIFCDSSGNEGVGIRPSKKFT